MVQPSNTLPRFSPTTFLQTRFSTIASRSQDGRVRKDARLNEAGVEQLRSALQLWRLGVTGCLSVRALGSANTAGQSWCPQREAAHQRPSASVLPVAVLCRHTLLLPR